MVKSGFVFYSAYGGFYLSSRDAGNCWLVQHDFVLEEFLFRITTGDEDVFNGLSTPQCILKSLILHCKSIYVPFVNGR